MADLLKKIFRHGYNNNMENSTSREPAFVVDIAAIFPNHDGEKFLLLYGMSVEFWVHMTLVRTVK